MPHRLTKILLVAALSTPLAGCGGGMFGGGFDPGDLLNFLDTKKPLPGERKAVFPEGVPGIDQGVPQEMVKGSPGAVAARQQIEQSTQPQIQTQQPGPQQAAVAPAETENAEEAPPRTTRPPPAARPKAPAKRRSVTAPPPEAQSEQPAAQQPAQQPAQSSSPFPSPFSQPKQSGSFSR